MRGVEQDPSVCLKRSLTSFFPSSSCTRATSSSCCLRPGNSCGCCQTSTASPPATAKKSLFAVSCRKASETGAVDFTFYKIACKHGWHIKLGRERMGVFFLIKRSKSRMFTVFLPVFWKIKLLTLIVWFTGDLHGQLEDLLLIFYKVRNSFNFTCQ